MNAWQSRHNTPRVWHSIALLASRLGAKQPLSFSYGSLAFMPDVERYEWLKGSLCSGLGAIHRFNNSNATGPTPPNFNSALMNDTFNNLCGHFELRATS